MPATIHMLCGFIASGKTTFARRLEAERGGVLLSNDRAMVTLFGTDPDLPRAQFDAMRARIDRLNLGYAQRLLELGVDVVLDNGFWTRSERDAIRAFAAARGAGVRMYYIDCPAQKMRARAVARSQNPDNDAMLVTAETWDSLRARFEPPASDEVFEIVASD